MSTTSTGRDADGRTRLLDTAERMLDEEGIDGVSMRRLTSESGHRNASAVNYHFGGRAGLIHAVLARRRPEIERRRMERIDELEAAGQATPRALLGAIIEPMVDLLDDAGGRRNLRLLFQAAVHPLFLAETAPGVSPAIARLMPTIAPLVERLSPERRAARFRLVTEMALFALAEQSRLLDVEGGPRPPLERDVFLDDLLDMMLAALSA